VSNVCLQNMSYILFSPMLYEIFSRKKALFGRKKKKKKKKTYKFSTHNEKNRILISILDIRL
jgi:hypothetical protein